MRTLSASLMAVLGLFLGMVGTPRAAAQNLQGPMFTFYLPSPSLARHLFWRSPVGVYTFHTTLTSTDPSLTALQKSQRSATAFLTVTMMYRF